MLRQGDGASLGGGRPGRTPVLAFKFHGSVLPLPSPGSKGCELMRVRSPGGVLG